MKCVINKLWICTHFLVILAGSMSVSGICEDGNISHCVAHNLRAQKTANVQDLYSQYMAPPSAMT